MHTHFTLLVGARAALLLQHFGKEEDKAWIFPANGPVFYDTMAKALKERPAATLRVIFDCKSLDLCREDLPPVDPVRRQKIVKQQAAHHFPKALLRGSGSWREGNSFQALHAACSSEPHLELLLQHLNTLPSQVEYLAFFAAEWADHATEAKVELPRPWCVALVLSEAMGLRQIVLKDGKPAFTRLHEECAPSMGVKAVGPQIAQHLRSTRDYLPRLSAPKEVPAMLFVPSSLEGLSENEELRALDCRVAVLKSPHANLLPPEWEGDISWVAQVAAQKLPLVPLEPFWMKERKTSLRIRKVIALLLMLFGMGGIYMGSSIMFAPRPAPEPPPAPVVEVLPPVEIPKAPELKLEALIYNAPEDWSVWINGQKFSMSRPVVGTLSITGISPDAVQVRWADGDQIKDYELKTENAASGSVR